MATSRTSDGDDAASIPTSEKDINSAWVIKNLGITPLQNTLSVEGNVQVGFGFMSNMVRLSFQTNDGKRHNILIKLLPTNAEFKQAAMTEKLDEKEILFYEMIRPKLLKASPAFQKNLCTFYCAKKGFFGSDEYASMIVMEDLKPSGYQMLNPKSPNWEDNLVKVVDCIAEFHMASLALDRTSKAKIPELFPHLLENSWDGIIEIAKSDLPKLQAILGESDVPEDVRAAYKLTNEDLDKHLKIVLEECSKHPCLIHGDLWPSNIMMVEDSDLPVKLIDWQLLSYRDPSLELVVTIMNCLPNDKLTRENLTKYCKIYLDRMGALGADLGRSESEFHQFFETWAMAYAHLWFLMSIGPLLKDLERLKKSFTILQQEYKIIDFLRSKIAS